MRRSIARIASVLALALATAALAGAAAAGNGNGNEAAPGQVKKDQAAQPAQPAQPAPAQPQQSAPGQAKKEQAASPQAAPPPAQSNGVHSTQAGKKPSSTTSKWTHCTTGGGQGAGATCTGVNGTPADQPDVSKRYGNGKTAAQIANGRGAPAGTLLTGPGNSQPHKVTACGKPNNKSGGVDVHAVKSYDSAKCQAAVATEQPSVKEEHVCGAVITTGKTQEVVGVLHGSHEHLVVHGKSAKHSVTKVTPTGETCGTAPQTQSNGSQAQSNASQTQSSIVVQALPATQGLPAAASQPATASASSATPNATAAQSTPAATQGQGGVAGVQASLSHPTKSKGGVLGAAGSIAGASLPFTGFPLWVAVLIAIALIAAGLVLRRRGPDAPRI